MSGLPWILHVENDSIDVTNLKRALARLDVSTPVETARNGKEALERLHALTGDDAPPMPLVLLDIGMPIMGGLEFLEALRCDPALRPVPVVMLTASDRDEERRRAYELGAAGYFVKPLAFDEFAGVIDAIVRYWSRSAFV